jgi:hypothetical protein
MDITLRHLRRGLLGIAFVGSLGFGATQALASPDPSRIRYCTDLGTDYYTSYCAYGCPGNRGYCQMGGRCVCGEMP